MLLLGLLAFAGANAQTTLIWDPNGAGAGTGTGGGIWDTTTLNWTANGAGTDSTVAWTNDGTVAAAFPRSTIAETYAAGSSYTVNVASAINVRGMDIGSSVWNSSTVLSFSGAGSLALTDPSITVRAVTAVIAVPLASNGGLTMNATFAGILRLDVANPNLQGVTTLNSGTLVFNHPGALGPESTGNGIGIGDGTLNFNYVSGGDFAYTLADPITIWGSNSNSPRISIAYDSGANRSITLTGPITLDEDARLKGGSLYGTGSARIVASGVISESVAGRNVRMEGDIVLSGTNTFTGRVIVALDNSYSGVNRVTVPVFNNELSAGPLGQGTGLQLGRDNGEGGASGEVFYSGGTATSNRSIQIEGPYGLIGISNSASTLTLTGLISGTGGSVSHNFEKDGPGTLVLTAANTYTGNTTIKAGTLLANNASGSALGANWVQVESGATLGGGGFIGGTTTIVNGGHLAPGNSAGTLTFTNGLTLLDGAILDFQLGTTSDKLVVSGGALTGPLGGTVTLNLSDAGGFAPGSYTLFDFTGATTSNFDASIFSLGTLPGGAIGDYSFAIVGTTLTLTTTASAIPEPAAAAGFFGLGALGWAAFRHRRRIAV